MEVLVDIAAEIGETGDLFRSFGFVLASSSSTKLLRPGGIHSLLG